MCFITNGPENCRGAPARVALAVSSHSPSTPACPRICNASASAPRLAELEIKSKRANAAKAFCIYRFGPVLRPDRENRSQFANLQRRILARIGAIVLWAERTCPAQAHQTSTL